jgi:lambda family phage portal protein
MPPQSSVNGSAVPFLHIERPLSVLSRVLDRLGFAPKERPVRQQYRSYAAAQVNRLTEDWYTSILSADQELKADLRRLRGASRSLVRDNGDASRYTNMIAENVIGHQGIQLQMEMMTTRGVPNEAANEKIEDAWEEWCCPENADAARRLSWIEQQALIARVLPQDGEVVIRLIRGAPNDYLFALQILDADLLNEQYGGSMPLLLPNGNEVRMGVELDARLGFPVAYYLWTTHPSEPGSRNRKMERVPAEDIIHLYIALRPGQTRGVVWFAPVLISHKIVGAYEEAEVTAARIGASNMFAIQIDAEKAGDFAAAPQGASEIPFEASPGQGLRLNPGESIVNTDFNHPSTSFGPFIKNVKRAIASGLNVSYTALTGDLEAVNYSSIRAGLLSERDFYRSLQTWLSCHLHRVVFREWTKYAMAAGKIPIKQPSEYVMAAQWKPRGWAWVDPFNDIRANAMAVQEGFITRSDVCAERGFDFEENIERLAIENKMATDAGLALGAQTPHIPIVPETAPADNSQGQPESAKPNPNRALELKLDELVDVSQRTLEVSQKQRAATDWMATKDQPAPVVHVAPPDVTINLTAEMPKGGGKKTIKVERNARGEMVAADITEAD